MLQPQQQKLLKEKEIIKLLASRAARPAPLFPSAGRELTCAQHGSNAGGLGLHHIPRSQGIAHSDTRSHTEA